MVIFAQIWREGWGGGVGRQKLLFPQAFTRLLFQDLSLMILRGPSVFVDHNDKNPNLNFLKGTVLGDKEQGGRDKG